MSLSGILNAELTPAAMVAIAGGKRSKGADTKEEKLIALELALAAAPKKFTRRLPEAAQRKLRTSPAAQRELSRISTASAQCSNWRQLQRVLDRFPPSVLFQIINEEMTEQQMRKLAGATR